ALLLDRAPRPGRGAEVVEPGLAHGPHPGQRGQRLDLAQRTVETGEPGRVVGVYRDRGQHRLVPAGQVGRPARRRDVRADLHEPVHTHGRGRLDVAGRVAPDDVQVRVAVQHRYGQRLGRRGYLTGAHLDPRGSVDPLAQQ